MEAIAASLMEICMAGRQSACDRPAHYGAVSVRGLEHAVSHLELLLPSREKAGRPRLVGVIEQDLADRDAVLVQHRQHAVAPELVGPTPSLHHGGAVAEHQFEATRK